MLTRHPWDKILIALFFIWLAGWYLIDTRVADDFWKAVWSGSLFVGAMVLGVIIDRHELATAWRNARTKRKSRGS
jgi:hypothetical protein